MTRPPETAGPTALAQEHAVETLLRYLSSLIAWRLLAFLGITLLWAAVSTASAGRFPGPLAAYGEFLKFAFPEDPGFGLQPEKSIWFHTAASAARAYGGLLMGFAIFFPLGVLLGTKATAYRASAGIVEFGRSVPAFMLLLVLLSLHIRGECARMICISYAVGIVLLDYTMSAARNVPQEQTEVFRLMRTSPWRLFWMTLWVPLWLNALLPALRIGVGVSLIVALVVETMIQPESGLGVLLNASLGRVDIAAGLVLILVTGFLGWAGNLAVTIISDVSWWVLGGRPLSVSR